MKSATPESDLPKELSEVSVVTLTDPTAVHETIQLLNQDIVNLDPEAFEVKRITVPLKDCCLIYQRSNVALRTQTRIHKDFDACTILGPEAHATVDGRELHSLSLGVTGPGAQMEVIVNSGYESITWLVPPRILNQHLLLRGTKSNFVIPEHLEIWHPPVEIARDHFDLGRRMAEEAEESPGIFNDNR